MPLLFYVIKKKTGAIFKTHMLCLLSNFLLHEMPHKKIVSFQKDMLEKCCAVVKSYWWHVEKIIIYWEIIMSHSPKYYVKSLKRN